jgi:flagellar basal body rod protein FlgG
MLSGFYTAASGMFTQQRTIDVVSNNLVNSQTTGFRAERLVSTTFEHALMTRIEHNNNEWIGVGTPLVLVDDIVANKDGASLVETERPFDFAVVGDAFFTVQGGERQYLTRNGNFALDEEGYLVLEGVGRVQGQNGDILLNTSEFIVDLDGAIFDIDYNLIDRLLVSVPAEGSRLAQYSPGLYGAADTIQAEDYVVFNNILERSNVDMNLEFTRLMEAQKAFTACSNALQIIDTMNGKSLQICSV